MQHHWEPLCSVEAASAEPALPHQRLANPSTEITAEPSAHLAACRPAGLLACSRALRAMGKMLWDLDVLVLVPPALKPARARTTGLQRQAGMHSSGWVGGMLLR